MARIFTTGETTFDIVFKNNQPHRAIIGGSALNTSVSLGRLGLPVNFISRISEDHTGEMSMKFLSDNHVNVESIVRYDGKSRLSIAFLDSDNNAEYQFYNPETLPSLIYPEVKSDDYILFGSSNAIMNEGRDNLICFLEKANKENVIVIYDPNVRKSDAYIKEKVEMNMKYASIIKASVQDFVNLYNISDGELIWKKVNELGVDTLILTDGEKPVSVFSYDLKKKYEIQAIETVSTIGAGDNFSAGLLAGFYYGNIKRKNIKFLKEKQWDKIINLSISFSSEVCRSEMNYISEEYAKEISFRF